MSDDLQLQKVERGSRGERQGSGFVGMKTTSVFQASNATGGKQPLQFLRLTYITLGDAEDIENDGTPKNWLYARFSQDKGNNNKNKGQSGRTGTSSTSRPLDLLVPCGKTSLVEIKKGSLLRLTYITLGDGESMEHESVKLFLKKEAWKEKRMMGTLDTKRIPQHKFNLFFNKNFEVSHDRTQGSVHYFGFIKKDSQLVILGVFGYLKGLVTIIDFRTRHLMRILEILSVCKSDETLSYHFGLYDGDGASTSHDASAAGRKPKKPNKNTTFEFA
ncbi:histone deacetylase HDT1 [Artemisia annua]|uniref:Histone deacetylase HDT1 n=1 Tax=Artemisia annua TaxID=35608 RepID=A0A2U1QFJ5_ARTAN|nr:histone deacetylase HDT1 [Artemisia annua]